MKTIILTVTETRTCAIPMPAIKKELNLNKDDDEDFIMYDLSHCSEEEIVKLCAKGVQIDNKIQNVMIETVNF